MSDPFDSPVLALDTSVAVAVSVVDDGQVLAAHAADAPRQQAELLAPLVSRAMTDSGTDVGDLCAVVVGTGPAPFTGLRVGLVTARTFALASGVPVHGVCSLDALALGAARDLDLAVGSDVLVVTDAKRREVYWARYRVTDAGGARGVTTTVGPGVGAAAALVEDGTAAGTVVVGPAAATHGDALAAVADVRTDGPTTPDPALLVELASAALARGEELPTTPLYLRRPDAQVPGARKRATG